MLEKKRLREREPMALGGSPRTEAGNQLSSPLSVPGGLLWSCPESGLLGMFPKPGARRGKEGGCGEPSWGGGKEQEEDCPWEIKPRLPASLGGLGQASPVRSKSESWTGPQRPSGPTPLFQSPEGEGLERGLAPGPEHVPILGVSCYGPGWGRDDTGQDTGCLPPDASLPAG